MNPLRTSHRHATHAVHTALLCLILCSVPVLAQGGAGSKGQDNRYQLTQDGRMSPYQGEQDGISAGGKWVQFQSEDKMTGAKKIRFELVADNYFREDPDYKPRIELFCEDGKFKLADFNPGEKLPPPNRPGFWGQPQLEVEVRIDEYHTYHGWNWVRGHFLAMDKGTARGLMSAHVFKIALPTRSGRQIAEFSPDGLNVDQVRKVCDITPKKPSKD